MALITPSSLEDALNNAVDRYLPAVCTHPESFRQLPQLLLAETECLKASLSVAIGFTIVLLAGVIKLPQISTILSNKSVAGLSIATFLLETFGYSYNLAAHYRQNYPVSTYGDFFILMIQNYIILHLCYSYNGRTQEGIAVLIAFSAGLVLMCSPIFPVEALRIMTLGNVAVVVASRSKQIYANYMNSSTGALNIITCWGIFLGACARIFTTLQDIDSLNILVGYLTSAICNGIIAFQIVYYRYFAKPVSTADKAKKAE